jgi:hypothetical protein
LRRTRTMTSVRPRGIIWRVSTTDRSSNMPCWASSITQSSPESVSTSAVAGPRLDQPPISAPVALLPHFVSRLISCLPVDVDVGNRVSESCSQATPHSRNVTRYPGKGACTHRPVPVVRRHLRRNMLLDSGISGSRLQLLNRIDVSQRSHSCRRIRPVWRD